jgi:biopolymer transport protein ExbD
MLYSKVTAVQYETLTAKEKNDLIADQEYSIATLKIRNRILTEKVRKLKKQLFRQIWLAPNSDFNIMIVFALIIGSMGTQDMVPSQMINRVRTMIVSEKDAQSYPLIVEIPRENTFVFKGGIYNFETFRAEIENQKKAGVLNADQKFIIDQNDNVPLGNYRKTSKWLSDQGFNVRGLKERD